MVVALAEPAKPWIWLLVSTTLLLAVLDSPESSTVRLLLPVPASMLNAALIVSSLCDADATLIVSLPAPPLIVAVAVSPWTLIWSAPSLASRRKGAPGLWMVKASARLGELEPMRRSWEKEPEPEVV